MAKPAKATDPNPADTETGVEVTGPLLSWSAESGVTGADLYIGTDETKVTNGDVSVYVGEVDPDSYQLGNLLPNTTYYWRVDLINDYGTTEGDIWSFTTGLYTETGALSVYCRNNLLNHFFSRSTYTSPTIYVGLALSGTELTGGGYARVATTTLDWGSASNGVTTNLAAIAFAVPTSSWGLVSQIMLFDAISGGQEIGRGSLTESVNIPAGLQDIQFDISSIFISLTGSFNLSIRNAMLDHIFKSVTLEQIDECWLALCDIGGDEPEIFDSGSTASGEFNGYDREQMYPADWTDADEGAVTNDENLVFGQPTSSWGYISHGRLYRSFSEDSAGEPLCIAEFISGRTVTTETPAPTFLAGTLRVRLI